MQKGSRRNLLAALAVIPFGGLAYWFGREQGFEESEDEFLELQGLPYDGAPAYDRARPCVRSSDKAAGASSTPT